MIVWDLRPKSGAENDAFLTSSVSSTKSSPPTALVISFAYPLCSISSHESSSKEFIVSDSRGSVFVVDWRKDPLENEEEAVTHQNFIELVHPRSLADSVSNIPSCLSGYASWHENNPNMYVVFGIYDIPSIVTNST